MLNNTHEQEPHGCNRSMNPRNVASWIAYWRSRDWAASARASLRHARVGVACLIVRGPDLEAGSTARSSWTCSLRVPSASDLRGPV